MSVLVWNLSRQGFGSRWGEIVRGALTLRRDLGVWKLSLLSNLPAFTTRRLLLADRWYITFYCSHLLWLACSPGTHSHTLSVFSLSSSSLPYRWQSNTHTHTHAEKKSFHSDISTWIYGTCCVSVLIGTLGFLTGAKQKKTGTYTDMQHFWARIAVPTQVLDFNSYVIN